MSKPDFLYHYTSIDGLAHILRSKKIRFSRLDLLDDVNEGQSKDSVDWRKYYFVSCWTADEEESIPLWHMYTPEMKGVRLKLPTKFFKSYEINLSEVPKFIHLADTSKAPEGANIRLLSYMPYDMLHGEDYFVMPNFFDDENWPLKVEYTNNEDLLNQDLIRYNEHLQMTFVNSFEVAKYKKKVWSFQDEWRFRICCFNAAPRSLKDEMSENDYYNLMVKELSTLGKGVSQQYFFMEIDDNAFKSIEISLGPKLELAQEIIVDALVKTYCPTASVIKSTLSGHIR